MWRRELFTLVVQHAEAKSGKSATSIGSNLRSWHAQKVRTSPREASWSGAEWAGLGLLLADDLPVYVDVIQHHDAGAGFRSAVMDKVDALHLATRRDGRNSLRRVGRIEA